MKIRIGKHAVQVEQSAIDWNLSLYVAGPSPKSALAFSNLQKICDEHLKGRYRINVIDLAKNPQLAQDDQILAVPTTIRRSPSPIRKIIGDLSNTERALTGLELPPLDDFPFTVHLKRRAN